MYFINSSFLFFLPLVIVPLIIHYLFFKKQKKAFFSSLFLIKRAYAKNHRLMEFKKYLIFILRFLIVLLLVAAFAKPVIKTNKFNSIMSFGGSSDESVKLLILIDRSYSMRQELSGKSAYDISIGAAVKILKSLGENDKAAVAFFSQEMETKHIKWTDDFAALENIMKMSKPGFKGTDYASALEKSYQFLLKEKGEKKVILVAGDAARHGFKNSLWKLRDSPAYSKDIIILGTYFKSECNNSYIKNVFINSAPEAKLSARIVNDGKKKSDYKIILTGNSFKEDRVVDGLSDKNSLIEFILPKKKQSVKGSQRCGSISLMEDSLSIDNEFFYAFKKPAGPIKTLLLYGNPNQLKAGYSAYFLKKLLNNSSSVDFKLSDAQRIEKNELKQYRLIICVGRKTAALLRDELKDFVSGGGKLWLIPSSLGREGAKNFARDYEFKTENLKTGAYGLKPNLNLSFFKENNFSGFDLDKIAVKRFLNIKEEKNILWEFKDARNETYPALLSKPLGLGSIALFTSSFDVSWSDMALKPVFADFIFSFIKLFSLADLNRKEKSMIYVGEKFKAHLSSPQSPKIKISGPQNKIYFEHPKNGNFIFERAHAPGIYRWTDSDGGNRCFAVNIDRRRGESELVKSNVPGSRINLKDPLLDFNAAVYGAQLWRTLLLIIVLLFILEGVLSEKI